MATRNQKMLLLSGLPKPFATFNFMTTTAENLGFSNSRTGAYYEIGSDGNYAVVNASTCANFCYTPAGVPVGLGVWRPYTNNVRNNSMQGAAVGTPGTLPTNWETSTGAVNKGTLVANVIAVGTNKGVDTIKLQITGSPAGAGVFPILFDTNTIRVATTAQAWTTQLFAQIAGGDLTNVSSIGLGFNENTSAGVIVQTDQTAIVVPSSGNYASCQFTAPVVTSGGATVARIQSGLFINYTGTGAINVTIEIGWPMLIQSTSILWHPPVRTTTVAVAVQQDNPTIALSSIPGFPSGNVTIVTEYMLPAVESINGVTTVTIDDGTVSNRYEQSVNVSGSAGGGIGASVTEGGVTKAVLDGAINNVARGVKHRIASHFSTVGVGVALDGSGPITLAGSSSVLALTTMRLGRIANGNDPMGGYIQRIECYNARDSQLSGLSRGLHS